MRTLKYKKKPDGLDYVILLKTGFPRQSNDIYLKNIDKEIVSYLKTSGIKYKIKRHKNSSRDNVISHILMDSISSCFVIQLMYSEYIKEIMKIEEGAY